MNDAKRIRAANEAAFQASLAAEGVEPTFAVGSFVRFGWTGRGGFPTENRAIEAYGRACAAGRRAEEEARQTD